MRRSLIAMGVVVLAATVGLVAWRTWPLSRTFYTDADTIKTPTQSASLREILWQPPKRLPGLINASDENYEPRISADGMTLLFVRHKAGDNADIYYSRKTPDGWTEPAPLDGVNSDSDDLGPVLTRDGRSIYFYSNRTGSLGGYDLWMAARRSDDSFEFDEAINLGPGVNSPYNEYGPSLTSDGSILYFSSNRPTPQDKRQPNPDAWKATLREDLFHRTYDLYMAVINDRGVGTATPLVTLNTPYNEGAPAVSPVGDFLYFASDRPDGAGGFDLYRSRRLHGGHEPAEPLGDTVNSPANDLDPSLGMGGYALYFSSDRAVQESKGATGQARSHANRTQSEYNLYRTTSREVFLDSEQLARTPIDWAAIWSALWPNLLWLLIALAAVLLLWALMRTVEDRRVGLLTKCVLASMLLHLVLVLLLTIWGVTATLAGEFHKGGKIQISLASPTASNDLATQVTGMLTAVAPPPAEAPTFEHIEDPHAEPIEARQARLEVRPETIPTDTKPSVEMTVSDATAQWRDDFKREATPPKLQPESVPLDVSTPKETARDRSSEVADEVSPSEQSIAAPRRPEIDTAAGQASTRAVDLTPTTTDRLYESGELRRSLADKITIGDAAPVAVPEVVRAEVAVPAELPPAPGLQLAMATSQRLPEATEVPLDATDRKVDMPNLRVQNQPPAESAPNPTAELAPAPATEPVDVSVSSNEAQLAQAADAAPTVDTAMVNVEPVEIELPHEQFVDVTAPTESTREAHVEEPTPDARPARAPQPIRPTEVAHDAPDVDQPPDEVQPERVERTSDTSMADATLPDAAVDRTMPKAAVDRSTDSKAKTVAADEVAINLPKLEEAERPRAEEAEEAEPTVERVAMADVRANVNPRVTDTPDEALLPKRDFEPLPDREDDHDDTTLASPAEIPDADATAAVLIERDRAATAPPSGLTGMALDLGLPKEETPPQNPYLQRTVPNRMDIVKRRGGSEKTEKAVARALQWLARHQEDDGHWDIRAYDRRCGGCDSTQAIHADMALTGLATLCFLGAGHTHQTDGPYRATVARAIDWLLEHQASNGDLRGEETMYTQGIASIALSEALAMTDDERLREPVELALRFIYAARNRREGGWRYDPGQPGDTSVLGWMMMAMKSASITGVGVPQEAFNAGEDWLDKIEKPKGSGLYAYRPEEEISPSMTAEAMFIRQLLGHHASEPKMQASADYILRHLPDWDEDPNTYYWYYASLAMFQHGGDAWRTWNAALSRELVDHQRADGRAAGSWDPQGNQWSMLGGRVYQTSLCALMLEVYYRYLPLYAVDEPEMTARPEDAVGMIAGVVRDADTNRPLVGATVRLDIPDGAAIVATTDHDGFYYLWAPELPPFFALSASRDGYTPDSINVDGSKLESNMLDVDFELRPANGLVVATEVVPEVHHLGDNRFDGTINSRFQKQSEGAQYGTTFTLTAAQLAGSIRTAELHLLAKGVQRKHKVFINGNQLDHYLDHAPGDGSFGEFVIPFEPNLLLVGSNKLDIVAKPSTSDIDDFEFVNVQIHLKP